MDTTVLRGQYMKLFKMNLGIVCHQIVENIIISVFQTMQ